MTTRLRRAILLLGTAILMMQSVSISGSMVSADTSMDTEEHELVELLSVQNSLEELFSDPHFFFPQSQLQGKVEEPLQVTFFSDKEVSEARVILPKEATIIKEQLPEGISVEQGEQSHEWIIHSERIQTKFGLPLVFDTAGSYEVFVEEVNATIEIQQDKSNNIMDSTQDVEQPDNSVKDEEKDHNDKTIDEDASDENTDGDEGIDTSAPLLDQPVDDVEEKIINHTHFDGETIEVNTFEEFRLAVANPEIGVIEVRDNLNRSDTGVSTAIGSIDRSLLVKGNGHSINFGADNGSLVLSGYSESTKRTLRFENTTLSKIGQRPIFESTDTDSYNWVVELENIGESSINRSPLILARRAKIHFTGGVNKFENTQSASDTFINVTDIEVSGSSEVNIEKANTYIFYTAPDMPNPSININDNSYVNIKTLAGTANVIDMRGENAKFNLENSSLTIDAIGTTAQPSNTSNNVITLPGARPTVSISGQSNLTVRSTASKRGLHLSGDNPKLLVENSELSVTSETQSAVNLEGTGADIKLNDSHVNVNTTIGYGINLRGNTINFHASKSEIDIKTTGSANGITMNGQDSSLEILDNSAISIEGGVGVHENILVGNGNANPSLKVSDNSNISISARSNSNTAADGNNNAIRIDGASPILEVSKNSKISIDVLSGGRRSIFMNGESAVFTVDNNSEILSNNLYGTSIGMSTANAEVTIDNFSKINIESSARRNNPLINFAGGSNNLSIKNNASVFTKHVEFDNPGNNTRAISMAGSNNNISITSGGNLDLDNTHYTDRPSSGSISENFSTVYLGNGNNSFSIDNNGAEGTRSQLRLINDYASALHSAGGHLTFNQNPDTVFYAEGSSNSTREYGVFVAEDTMEFNVDSPYYFDFKNVRQAGGDIFGTKAGSHLNITNTFFSAWSTGSHFDSDPDIGFFKKIDVSYEGRDFASASSNNNPDLSTSLPGLSGRVSRISANNSKPIFEGFRQPTNADKSFIAEFSYKEGLDDIREAGTNEITAEIKVTDPDNNSRNYTASTVGNESPIKTWEEKEANDPGKGGRILFEFEDLLKKGTTIEFVSISRGSNEGAIYLSEEELELISPITVLNVTPPELVDFGHNIKLTTNTNTIEAFPNSINIPGNNALLYINNQFIEKQQVKNDGSFSFELKSKLMEGDEVQVSMEDNEGVLIDNFSTIDSVFKRPETNSDYGNRNPIANDYTYHDAIFKKAKTYIVELSDNVLPVDPLDPEIEVTPENPPVLPEEQGPLSIDFASRFNFGEQNISVKDKTYYAQPQRLLNEDGTVNETQDRPNYIQISDRRPESKRNGWELAVTQNEQFKGKENQMLNGASLILSNQQVVTAQGGTEPGLQFTVPCRLVPGNRRTLLKAQGNEGTGTWIYRFGDSETAGESVSLYVPKGTNPEATSYSTTLTWELSAVPDN
ncbi:WxL domain-containing protein [Enterococcus mundtii]|nr:WxL domain-containing protein [Enterococcus mundtii]SFM45213.1 WxL domain surface cell wall-binding [Enterococcus mundtii]